MRATIAFDVETYEMTANRLSELIGDVLWGSDSMPSGCNISPVRVSIEADDSQHFEAGEMVPLVEGTGKSMGTVTVAKVDRGGKVR